MRNGRRKKRVRGGRSGPVSSEDVSTPHVESDDQETSRRKRAVAIGTQVRQAGW